MDAGIKDSFIKAETTSIIVILTIVVIVVTGF